MSFGSGPHPARPAVRHIESIKVRRRPTTALLLHPCLTGNTPPIRSCLGRPSCCKVTSMLLPSCLGSCPFLHVPPCMPSHSPRVWAPAVVPQRSSNRDRAAALRWLTVRVSRVAAPRNVASLPATLCRSPPPRASRPPLLPSTALRVRPAPAGPRPAPLRPTLRGLSRPLRRTPPRRPRRRAAPRPAIHHHRARRRRRHVMRRRRRRGRRRPRNVRRRRRRCRPGKQTGGLMLQRPGRPRP